MVLLLLTMMMLCPGPPCPFAKRHGPHLDAICLVDKLVEIGPPKCVPAVRGCFEPLKVVPAVKVAILDAPVEVGLYVSVLVVGHIEGNYAIYIRHSLVRRVR